MIKKDIEKYIDDNCSNEDELLYKINRETNLKTTLPRMLSGKIQGKHLEMISYMMQPKCILEIGTFTGYSALCLVKGLKPDGKLITIESNIELKEMVEGYFSNSNYSDNIIFKIGDAIDIIPNLEETFDLVFIDADKQEYIDYYNLIKPKLSQGGIILADNVLWSGKVTDSHSNDKDTVSIREFNSYVKDDPDVEQVILSVRDGLMVIRKK